LVVLTITEFRSEQVAKQDGICTQSPSSVHARSHLLTSASNATLGYGDVSAYDIDAGDLAVLDLRDAGLGRSERIGLLFPVRGPSASTVRPPPGWPRDTSHPVVVYFNDWRSAITRLALARNAGPLRVPLL
jgi:hypothetical protein